MVYNKEEAEIKDGLNNIHIKDELETGHEEEEGYTTIYPEEEVPCENLESSEATEDPLQLDEVCSVTSSSQGLDELETSTKCKGSLQIESITSVGGDNFSHGSTNQQDLSQTSECKYCVNRISVGSVVNSRTKIINGNKMIYHCEHCGKRFMMTVGKFCQGLDELETGTKCKASLQRGSPIKKSQKVEKPFQCELCEKCFSNKYSLKNHLIIHTGEKPYQCEICCKCFSLKNYLNSHLKAHTEENIFQCEICSRLFSKKSSLNRHLRTHTREKPYQCEICKSCFSYRSAFVKHLRTHSAEKAFQCESCKKCFSRKDNLRKHIMIHTEEKPFQCKICGNCFTYKHVLNSHLRTHTGEKPFQCESCNKCFSEKGYLKKHIKTHT